MRPRRVVAWDPTDAARPWVVRVIGDGGTWVRGRYQDRRSAARCALQGDPPEPYEACAEHPALGVACTPFKARSERGALRRAREILAPGFALAGWTWRVYRIERDTSAGAPPGATRSVLVASRRGESVRGWCRPAGDA